MVYSNNLKHVFIQKVCAIFLNNSIARLLCNVFSNINIRPILGSNIARMQHFKNIVNSFQNILRIVLYFIGIFLHYFLNISVLCRCQLCL